MRKQWIANLLCLTVLSILACWHGVAHAATIAGNRDGKVTLVEFMDYECPHCRHEAPVISRLIENNPNLRVVYRVIPAFGEASFVTDSAVLAAKLQGEKAYQQFRSLILNQNAAPDLHTDLMLAKEAGLNIHRLIKDMRSAQIMQTLQQNFEVFYATKKTRIPVMMIGTLDAKAPAVVLVGEQPYSALQAAISSLEGSNHD